MERVKTKNEKSHTTLKFRKFGLGCRSEGGGRGGVKWHRRVGMMWQLLGDENSVNFEIWRIRCGKFGGIFPAFTIQLEAYVVKPSPAPHYPSDPSRRNITGKINDGIFISKTLPIYSRLLVEAVLVFWVELFQAAAPENFPKISCRLHIGVRSGNTPNYFSLLRSAY